MSDSVTATWLGASAYTPPAGDAVTASWAGAGPEMPAVPLTLSLLLASAAYPSFEYAAPDPLAFGLTLPQTSYGIEIDAILNSPLAFGLSLPAGAVPEFHYGINDPLLFRLLLGSTIPDYRMAPEQVLPGYSSDGTSITFPISSVIGLTVAEADAVTGDWREILQAILLRAFEYQQTWVWSDRPVTYRIFGHNQYARETLDRSFAVTFFTNMGEPNVAPEP